MAKVENEIWKAVPGYEGWYDVSNFGRIRSYHNYGNGRRREPRMIRATKDCFGYLQITLCLQAIHEQKKVHQVVASAFLPKGGVGMQIDHVNGVKTDNRADNLEWVTPKENTLRSVALGLKPSGERHWNHKLTEQDVSDMRELYSTGKCSHRKLGEMFGVSHNTVGRIVRGEGWRVEHG